MSTKNTDSWISVRRAFPWTGVNWFHQDSREDSRQRSNTDFVLRSERCGRVVQQSGDYTCAHARTEVVVNSLGRAAKLKDIARLLLVIHAWGYNCDCRRTDWEDRFGVPYSPHSEAGAKHWAMAFVEARASSSVHMAVRDQFVPCWSIDQTKPGKAAA